MNLHIPVLSIKKANSTNTAILMINILSIQIELSNWNSTLHGIKSLLDHKYRTLIEDKFISF